MPGRICISNKTLFDSNGRLGTPGRIGQHGSHILCVISAYSTSHHIRVFTPTSLG
jgi:hypothetical protein